MTEHGWRDLVVGDRMAVDQEFAPRVAESEFSRQEWGLIMTAVEFEIEDPGGAAPRLVADTSLLPQVMPEVDRTRDRMAQMAGGTPGGGGRDDGLLDAVRGWLGLSDDVDEARLDAARGLAEAYAEELQTHLESTGKWKQVCEAAAD